MARDLDPDVSRYRAIGETPPTPPGESPFHIRGTGYIGHLQWVDQHFPGGRLAFLALLSPSMRTFFSQTFLAISMHDFLPLAAAGQVCARARGMKFAPFIEMRGRHQANLDIGGVYRVLLKLTSTKMIANKLPAIMAKYFDFGVVRALSSEPHSVKFEVTGIPTILLDWFAGCYAGYVQVVVPAAGGEAPTLTVEEVPTADCHGFPAANMIGTIRWT